jgi:hypothetical protein
VSEPYQRKTTGRQRNTASKYSKHAKWQQRAKLSDNKEHEEQSHEHKPHTRNNKHTNQNTSPQRRNTAGRTPNNTIGSESGLLEDIRRTGRGRKQQKVLQQAVRNAEAQEHTPGH